MPATAGTPRARALSAALREARLTNGMGSRELARHLELSHTQISHWENGHRVPNVENVAMILTALRISPRERERILDLARNVAEPNWLTVGMNGIPQQLAGVVECERSASSIVEWSPMVIPGLLQTSDYTRAIKEAAGLPQTDVELRVMLNVSRREVLTRRSPVSFHALIGEAGLYEPIGPDGVVLDQLRHLAEMAKRPNVLVQLMPQGIGWHPGWAGPFVVYEFLDASPVVHFEHHSSGAFIPTEHDVAEYRKAVERLREIAIDEAESVARIEKAISKWEEE
ncbi:Helix-turn-helix domain-containing protein [Saccharopolyspora antimicrobica]|uniref:Helix-turn-helix domain-containing protein n=1 Tax=Saccharopolyspora antimicrobica TaxID=455193 RepID=A0A1I5H2L3_9PSEU|nr:helix-turn-helix transcriptional regulator [Saccharopolyspora antimicrobica]RKT90093.1 helix-turn-helix protein [Saccharopolyspora antimicrobica]SFO42350.1 Helix-turn-helix domain-containing protein [Saccharopolyspora antimicrobica]